ncbi:general transcription factor 3C polypeptide 4 [Cololabis saira]|uniref:general transcription factor 3C polypeptide 4 n=1 Tax=Cololabis saira TaxID=129043 RepID=UPI002AD21B2A|nr:general transcription factor 3C polypeptide 4 [Cololabis saira]
MAAVSPSVSARSHTSSVLSKTDSEHKDDAAAATPGEVLVKREPVVPLTSPVCGLQPLRWSQDHRLAACTAGSLAVMELQVDGDKQDLRLARTSIPVPSQAYKVLVGPSAELSQAMNTFTTHPDIKIRQVFLADQLIHRSVGMHKGIKYASWSPIGCDSIGRCLLACLTLEDRLTIHNSHKPLDWNMLVDLTKKYGERLTERGYARKDGKRPKANLLDFDELQRRFRMQSPLRMEWSSIYSISQVQPDNSIVDVEMVLLAVLMDNGDIVLWKFELPFTNGEDVMFYDLIESSVNRPTDLAWWEYRKAARQMSGLIIGSEEGPVKIMPVSLTGVKGYFTLKHPIILWKECDGIPVENIRCVSLIHPIHKTPCSLIVASRGCYVFWCLLLISSAGLNVQNAHITGLHSLPVVSVAVSQHDATVYTCSMDGWIKKLTPQFNENLIFNQEDIQLPESLSGRRFHGIAVSHNGAYIALVSTQGIVDGFHPTNRTYQVHFVTLKTAETAAALLMKSTTQSLYKMADLLDLVRWNVLKHKCIPKLDELNKKIQQEDSPYLWRLKLFLLRILQQSLQAPQTDDIWRPNHLDTNVLLMNEGENKALLMNEGECGKDNEAAEREERWWECNGIHLGNEKSEDEEIAMVRAEVRTAETHLVRENMKKVLGMVYLNTWIGENTSVPTCGLMDYLSKDASDKAAEVLINHVRNKTNKQTFPERCSLCQAVLPFTDHTKATCEKGHTWLRCGLSYQACQTLTFRRCLLLDTIARLPEPEDPEWIKKILQAPCIFCDSPMI